MLLFSIHKLVELVVLLLKRPFTLVIISSSSII